MPSPPRPDDPLHNWEEWGLPFSREPVLIRALGHGRTNQSYLIEADNEKWVLRRNNEEVRRLGVDRQREATILKQIAHTGITPQILYCSPEQGVMISAFIDGQCWTRAMQIDKNRQTQLIELLQGVHQLEIDLPVFDYRQHLQNYWEQLQSADIDIPGSLYAERKQLGPLLEQCEFKRSLCHHDPIPENIIESNGKLLLIDWEYAAMGWPGFDYAVLAKEWRIFSEMSDMLHDDMLDQLESWMLFYSHLVNLWTLLNGNEYTATRLSLYSSNRRGSSNSSLK